jgi:hypothetical protein
MYQIGKPLPACAVVDRCKLLFIKGQLFRRFFVVVDFFFFFVILSLHLEAFYQLFFVKGFFEIGSRTICLGLALICDSSELCLLGS